MLERAASPSSLTAEAIDQALFANRAIGRESHRRIHSHTAARGARLSADAVDVAINREIHDAVSDDDVHHLARRALRRHRSTASGRQSLPVEETLPVVDILEE